MVAAGKVRAVGVSNYSVHQSALLTRFLGRAPATNQVEVSLLQMGEIGRASCRERVYSGV